MEKMEEYEALRSTLLSLTAGSKVKAVAITGCTRKDGASTVAVGLAQVLAREGTGGTLLVDTNLRYPILRSASGVKNGKGLADLILNGDNVCDIICETRVPHLSLITAGNLAGHSPSEVFASATFTELVSFVREGFDYLIWDTPPVNVFGDASTLARFMDGVVLVVRAGKTRWEAARKARDQLERADANVLGVVLNRRRYAIPRMIYDKL
jgi:capsular exopolysaccharide synthesis family protein